MSFEEERGRRRQGGGAGERPGAELGGLEVGASCDWTCSECEPENIVGRGGRAERARFAGSRLSPVLSCGSVPDALDVVVAVLP